MDGIGEVIAKYRIANHMTQEQLAFSLGDVSASSVGQWELGKCSPTPDHILALADVLSIPCAELFVSDDDFSEYVAFDLSGHAVSLSRDEWEAYHFALRANENLDVGKFVSMIRSM